VRERDTAQKKQAWQLAADGKPDGGAEIHKKHRPLDRLFTHTRAQGTAVDAMGHSDRPFLG